MRGNWGRMRAGQRRLLAVLLCLEVLGAWAATGEARRRMHDPIVTTVTFNREVRAILRTRCGGCHVAGGPAPMPLTTYEEVRPWARAVKTQVLTRRMPKWHAAHGYGAFANDPSLTPAEITALVSWIDGGQPRGVAAPAARFVSGPAVLAFRRDALPLSIASGAADATLPVASTWIGGWYFEPGDPLITSASFMSADGTPIGTWVAGDEPVRLPEDAAVRITPPIRIQIQRRTIADYEKPAAAGRSILRLLPRETAPQRRVWTEQQACGAARPGRAANLIAVRPLLGDGGSARVWLERPGAPRLIVGWFRDHETRYPRTFWLERPADLPPESRVQADTACTIELTLIR